MAEKYNRQNTREMKIAFIIGHNEKDKGFYSEYLKLSEFDFYKSMFEELNSIGEVFLHDSTISSYTQRCIDISARIGDNYDLVIVLHFNSFDSTAQGTECFYWHTNEYTKNIAEWLCDEYVERLGGVNRGAKPYKVVNSTLMRGAGEVYYPKVDAVLFEPFFGDNKEDCERFCNSEFIKLMCDLKNLEKKLLIH